MTADDVRGLRAGLVARGRLADERKRLLAARTSKRKRAKDAVFDAPDALASDLWWQLAGPPDPRDRVGLDTVWHGPLGSASERRGLALGCMLSRRDGGTLIALVSFKDRLDVVWLPDGTPETAWQVTSGESVHGTLGWTPDGRIASLAWRERSPTAEPFVEQRVLWGDELPLAVRSRSAGEQWKPDFEAPAPVLPDDALAAAAEDDLVDALVRAVDGSDLAGATVYYSLPGDALMLGSWLRPAPIADALLAPYDPDDASQPLEFTRMRAPWSVVSLVHEYELLVERERDTEIHIPIARRAVRRANQRLTATHGQAAPVLIAAMQWCNPQPEDLDAVLTDENRAALTAAGVLDRLYTLPLQ